MKKSFALFVLLFLFEAALFSQIYQDPNFPKPSSGYGSDGPHPVGYISYPHPYFSGEEIEVFYPEDHTAPVPTLFFCHGYGGTSSLYIRGMLQFAAKKGYAVVYVAYPTTGVSILDRYDILTAGFRHAARNYAQIIDTTKVGFVGHSFGGGAIIGVSNRCFTEHNWGSAGRLLFGLAPWYSFDITQDQLANFPSDTKLLMHVYDEDVLNDHRMAIDIFENINIPDSEKDYIFVQPDTINGHVYQAGHDLPGTYQVFDAMDYYAFYRLLDALCDYTFNGALEGKKVALGNGSPEQVTMPGNLKPLLQSDDPLPVYAESKYEFNCSSLVNPRRDYCGLSSSTTPDVALSKLAISPNPATDLLTVTLPTQPTEALLEIWNLQGRLVQASTVPSAAPTVQVSVAAWPRGIYMAKVGQYVARFVVGE